MKRQRKRKTGRGPRHSHARRKVMSLGLTGTGPRTVMSATDYIRMQEAREAPEDNDDK